MSIFTAGESVGLGSELAVRFPTNGHGNIIIAASDSHNRLCVFEGD